MEITLTTTGMFIPVDLGSGPAARDLASLLPISLVLNDFNNTEKIANLPRALVVKGEPDGIRPSAGDLAYYAPWGNLAIFYRDFRHSRGLIWLGRLRYPIDAIMEIPEDAVVTVSPASSISSRQRS